MLPLTRSPIPILVAATDEQRDGRSLFPADKDVRGRKRKVMQLSNVRIIPSRLKQFLDSRERDKFEKEFGRVPGSDWKDLVYLIGLAVSISAGQDPWKVDLNKLELTVSRRAQGDWEFDRYLLTEAHETPAYALCKALNRGIQNSQFIVWWIDREHRLAPGLFCPDAATALFALVLSQIGQTGALGVCFRCGHVFLTHRARQVYCSSRCQTAAAMTRYRQKQKEQQIK